MKDAIHLSWTYTEADYIAANRRLFAGWRRGMGVVLFGVVSAFSVIALVPMGWTVALVVVEPLFLGATLFGMWRGPYRLVRRRMRDHPEAYPRGEVHFVADAAGVMLRIDQRQSQLPWTSYRRIEVHGDHVYLYLSLRHATLIPRRCLGADEADALARLRAWLAHPETAPVPAPAEEFVSYDLHYVLEGADFVGYAVQVQRRQLRNQPVVVVLGLLVGVLTTLLSLAAPDGGLSLRLSGWGLSAVFVVLGLARLWWPTLVSPFLVRRALRRDPDQLPVGEILLRVGPGGGWSQSSRGTGRFGWGDVSEVIEAEGLVGIMLGPVLGFVVPERAFDDAAARARFVSDCRRWQSTAPRRAPGDLPQTRRRPGVPADADPFAPPED